jgi:6-pyruvoyltetrahydropterin/6-carboxytetrahydropterin synthase
MKLQLKHHFDAAHRLENYSGPCYNLHGHRWEVLIEIEDEIDSKTGMIMDFKKIKELINFLDHTTILKDCKENEKLIEVIEESGVVRLLRETPTAEILALYIKDNLSKQGRKVTVTLWESPEASVTV